MHGALRRRPSAASVRTILLVVTQGPRHNEQALLPNEVKLLKILNKDGNALGLGCDGVADLALFRCLHRVISFLKVLEEKEERDVQELRESRKLVGGDETLATLVMQVGLQLDARAIRGSPRIQSQLLASLSDPGSQV
jgi:hypothetical protein